MESKAGLRVIKLTDASFLRTLEGCVRIGVWPMFVIAAWVNRLVVHIQLSRAAL
jgi:hypothetical protein